MKKKIFYGISLFLLICFTFSNNLNAQNWETIGPWGGDRHFICLHPEDTNTVLVGGAGGFIHRTNNGGGYWESLAPDSLLGSTSVEAILIHPDYNDTILCSASPLGIYKSYNNGITWHEKNTGLMSVDATSLLIAPDNHQKVYAGFITPQGQENLGGVYVSDNFGETWTSMNNGLGLTSVTRLNIDKDGKLYAATYGEGLSVYNDSLSVWQTIFYGNDSLITTVESHPYCPDTIIVGTYKNWLYKSVDGGDNWQQLPIPSEIGTDTVAVCYDIEYDRQNPDFIWTRLPIAKELPFYSTTRNYGDGTFFSFDGGNSWSIHGNGYTQIIIDDRSSLTQDYLPQRSSIIYATGGGESAILKSENGGIFFEPVVKGINGVFINMVMIDTYGRIFTGAEKGFDISRNRGNTWKQILYTQNSYEDIGYKWDINIDPQDSSILYCSKGELAHLIPDGKGLFVANLVADTGAMMHGTFGVGVWKSLCGNTCDTIFMATQSHGVWKTTDNGTNWEELAFGLDQLSVTDIYISLQTNNLLYSTTRSDSGIYWIECDFYEEGGFYKWDEQLQSWEKKINGMPPAAISQMQVNSQNDSMVYVSTFAHGIYKTTDAGENWINISPQGVAKIYSIAVDPTNFDYLYVGTARNGVYATFDGGQTWDDLNGNGLTNLVINYIAVDPINRDTLYVATLGGSVFKTPINFITANINKAIPKTKKTINIYPNPSIGTFIIEGKNIQTVEITNISGQIVYSYDDFKSSYQYQVDLSKQPKGVYLIKVTSDKETEVVKVVLE